MLSAPISAEFLFEFFRRTNVGFCPGTLEGMAACFDVLELNQGLVFYRLAKDLRGKLLDNMGQINHGAQAPSTKLTYFQMLLPRELELCRLATVAPPTNIAAYFGHTGNQAPGSGSGHPTINSDWAYVIELWADVEEAWYNVHKHDANLIDSLKKHLIERRRVSDVSDVTDVLGGVSTATPPTTIITE
jgi:hypothetical protein